MQKRNQPLTTTGMNLLNEINAKYKNDTLTKQEDKLLIIILGKLAQKHGLVFNGKIENLFDSLLENNKISKEIQTKIYEICSAI